MHIKQGYGTFCQFGICLLNEKHICVKYVTVLIIHEIFPTYYPVSFFT